MIDDNGNETLVGDINGANLIDTIGQEAKPLDRPTTPETPKLFRFIPVINYKNLWLCFWNAGTVKNGQYLV